MVAMEGSGGRRVSMAVVVAILVGLSSINVGGVRGQSSGPSSDKNCTAYLDPCSGETATVTATAEGCCNAVRKLVADVTCFCTIMREENFTKGDIQLIQQKCNVTLDTSICSSAPESAPSPPTNSTSVPPPSSPTNSSSTPEPPPSSPTNSSSTSKPPRLSPTNSSSSHKNEAFSVTLAMMPKWAVGLILLCIITTIIPVK